MKKIIITFCYILTATIFTLLIYFNFKPPCFGLGCTGDYTFQDTATYTAPKSKLEILVASSGYVPDGADIGIGKGYVKLYSTVNATDTMYLKTYDENIDTIIYKGKITSFICNQMRKDNFYNYLDSVGFKKLDENEIIELRDAMTSINYGHKAGFCKGQTRYIIVGEHIRHIK